ncbi:DNA mismatch repair protein MutS [Jejudonia soesokkakensis]|uniref:DNA mismatch repair protein MutS n=1 Tax=Jejudonia soesokkakensis TaxID=1323432 RepID=A0ABW2MWH5_9FLAO
MNKNVAEFYQAEIEKFTQDLHQLKKQLLISSITRLLLFLLVCVGIYVFFGNTKIVIAIIIAGIAGFLFLVTRHSKFQSQRDLIEAILSQNERELIVLNRNFHHLPDGSEYKNTMHEYSQDIDLFGRGSFYQYLNRTALSSGSDLLAQLLTENSITHIPKKQKAVQELAEKPQWRQRFSAIASLVKTETSVAEVTRWLDSYTSFAPSWTKIVSLLFSILSIAGMVSYYFGFISGYVLFGWFLLGLAISGRYLKRVNELSSKTSKIQSTFAQFQQLILAIEKEDFSSEMLSEKKNLILNTSAKASEKLKQFAKHLDSLDQRNNMLIGVIANGFFLRDLNISSKIEKWIAAYKDEVAAWFDVITHFDAYNSLGNYTFNHPSAQFATITEDATVIDLKGTIHPLLNPETAIANDFKIDAHEFFIITGANMAGKSTFLRTVGLQIVMSNMGLPTHVKSAFYTPIKLITSMRTTDSLTDDESYFFSELKRLKLVVDKTKDDDYFIILDEILKGTNSIDKAKGSKKFVEKLVKSNATGIIATHDLSLCEVANELPQVHNYFFDARIENNELFFDYTLTPGICKNMNASFLLKKMEIVE